MLVKPHSMRVFIPERSDFKSVKDSNVLIYWPHGFGDWVFLSYILPLFDKSNTYFVTRIGDDNTSVFDYSPFATPIYTGINRCSDRIPGQSLHFGLESAPGDGSTHELRLPAGTQELCAGYNIDTVVWSPFHEIWGSAPEPFHTKGRSFLRHMVSAEILETETLDQPLPTALSFAVESGVMKWAFIRLRNLIPSTAKICLISRTGYTAVGKNWGHKYREELPPGQRYEPSEAVEFVRLMTLQNPSWVFIALDEGDLVGRCAGIGLSNVVSYSDIFGRPGLSGIPFGLCLKALLNWCNLVVGVPAGPYHLAMAKLDLPVIGLWVEHFPSWYDEPRKGSIHLVGAAMRISLTTKMSGTFESRANLHYDVRWQDTNYISGQAVFQAAQELLS